MSFLNAEVQIPCKQCAKLHSRTIGWLDSHSVLKCHCGAITHIDTGPTYQQRTQTSQHQAEDRQYFKL